MADNPTISLGALKAELRLELFPTGQAPNRVAAHDKMFVDALFDLQQAVPCYQINNTQVTPFCNTKFQCGMTVFTAPRGRIWRLSTVDRIVAATGLESASAPVQWCSEIVYKQVEYCRLEKFVDKTLGCACSKWPIVPFPYCGKTANPRLTQFPVPDQSAYAAFPELPLGFIYPTPSTDSTCGRAKSGVWALNAGRIYMAPWVQSTELVLIEWDGLKRDWTDDDRVDDDPRFKEAVKLWVQAKCDRDYGCGDKYQQLMADYNTARMWLWNECNEENRIRECTPGLQSATRSSRFSGVTLEEQAPLVLPTTTTTTTTTNDLWKCSAGDCVQGNGTLASLYDCRLTGCEEPPECPPVPTSCPEGWVIGYNQNRCLVCCDVSAFDPARVEYLRNLWELLLCRPPSCAGLYYWASFWEANPTVPEEVIQEIWMLSDEYLSALVRGDGCGDPPPPTGRCCMTGLCLDGMSEAQCDNAGGVWEEGTSCATSSCHGDPPPTTTTTTTTSAPPYSCVDAVCVHDAGGPYATLAECRAACNTTTTTTTCGYGDWGNPPDNDCDAPCKTYTKEGGGTGTPAECWTCCDATVRSPQYGCQQELVDCIISAYQSILCRPPECGGLQYWYGRFAHLPTAPWAPVDWCNTVYATILAAAAPELALKIACGVCCYPDGHCAKILELFCTQAGGSFHAGKICAEVNCGGDVPFNCVNGNCVQQAGGIYPTLGECQANCVPPPPPTTTTTTTPAPTGSCCVFDPVGLTWGCTEITEAACNVLGGAWGGADAPCPSPASYCSTICPSEGNDPLACGDPQPELSVEFAWTAANPGGCTPVPFDYNGTVIFNVANDGGGFFRWTGQQEAPSTVGGAPQILDWVLECNQGGSGWYLSNGVGINFKLHRTGSGACGVFGAYALYYEDTAGYCSGNSLVATITAV